MAARNEPLLMVLMVIATLETIGSFAWLFWVFGEAVPGEASAEVASATRLPLQIQFVLGALALLTLISGYFAAVWMG